MLGIRASILAKCQVFGKLTARRWLLRGVVARHYVEVGGDDGLGKEGGECVVRDLDVASYCRCPLQFNGKSSVPYDVETPYQSVRY